MPELTTRDLKLIQYLNEAYGKEKELEAALQAHIAMTTRAPYKRRLQEHLRETKGHARTVERRIKQLGGKAEAVPAPGPDALADAAGAVAGVASRAVAAAKGPLHALRGTGEQERMLKNAKTEYSEEFEEIATYRAIETLAESVSDAETAKVARGIRREEERMARFLERLIPSLTKAVVQEEIPARERRSNGGRRRRKASSGTRKKSSATKSRAKSSAARSSTRRKGASTGGSRSSSSGRSRRRSSGRSR